MKPELRPVVDAIKAQVVEEVKGVRQANKMIPVSGTRYTLPLQGRQIDMVYYHASRENAPLLMCFHGGGFLFGGCAMDDSVWNEMRNQLDVNIASIDYRKTPDYMFPAPVEDAYDSAVYLKNHADAFGFDGNHISVCGNSSGASISAAVCILAKERGGIQFDYQILNYPSLDNVTDISEKNPGSLDDPIMYVFLELYVKPEDTANPLCSPVFATKEQLSGLPTAIIRTAENDNLREEGKRYAQMLKEAGVTVYYDNAENMPHGYFEYGFGTAMGQDFLAESIKAQIADGSIIKESQKALDFIKEHYKQ